jgi:dolichol-phosphate mannosyltransferase
MFRAKKIVPSANEPVRLISIVIPTYEEDAMLPPSNICMSSRLRGIEHDVVVDDGSTDSNCMSFATSRAEPNFNSLRNPGENGYGRAVTYGFDHMRGDAL